MITPDLSRLVWRKSSYSESNGGDCVEIAALPGGAAVRDSKAINGGVLMFDDAAWQDFRAALKDRAFDIV